MPAFTKSLFGQVMVALVLGVVAGVFWPDFAAQMKPLGDGFIKLIKMIIAPLVFGVVVHGIASAGDLKKVGRVGVKSIIYFEVVTTIALVLGIVVAYVFGPGHGMNIDPSTLDASALSTYTERAQQIHGAGRLPAQHHPLDLRRRLRQRRHPAGAGARGALRRGALPLSASAAQPVTHLIELVTEVLFKIIGFIVRLAPLGVFGAIAYTVGAYGVGSLQQLGYARRALLPHRRLLRLRSSSAASSARRLLDLQVPRATSARS